MTLVNITLPEIKIAEHMSILDGEEEEEPICGEYEIYTVARFSFIFVSSWIALLGIAGNLFLLYLFSTKNYPNTPPTLYPGVLAVLDAIICATYILLFGADAAIVFLHIKSLFTLYYIYVIPAFVISRITQLAIPYMLIFATLERFVWIAGNMRNHILKKMYSIEGRYITIAVSLSCCIILRMPTALATTIHEYPKCEDFFRSKTAAPADWVFENIVYHYYDFHLLSIAQTVVPFFVLLVFNVIVVKKIAKMDFSISNENPSLKSCSKLSLNSNTLNVSDYNSISPSSSIYSDTRELVASRKTSFRSPNPAVKSAIYTMLAIVTSYLVSNTLHLALSILERSNSDLLKHPTDPRLASTFHTVFSDLVSFVYMFTSALRLIIYYVCNPAIKEDMKAWLKSCFFKQKNGFHDILL